MAHLLLSHTHSLPWEFSCELQGKLYRSILPTFVSSGVSFWLVKSIGLEAYGLSLFMGPRIGMFLLSLVMDYMVRDMFGEKVWYVFSSSWVSLILSTRPISNALELFLLLLCIFFMRTERPFFLGLTGAFGVFNRITFPAFTIPVVGTGLLLLWENSKTGNSYWDRIHTCLGYVFYLVVGFSIGVVCHILADSLYASSNADCTESLVQVFGLNVVLTPLNSFMYNSVQSNLATHGIHSRFTHLLVNMQLLFSPIWIWGLTSSRGDKESRNMIVPMLKWIIMFALAVLSAAPHQEARFIIPLLVPVSVICADTIMNNPWVKRIWIIFNLCVACFYGVIHQGGLIPSLLFFESDSLAQQQIQCIATYETYMAPRYLLAGHSKNIKIFHDLGGASPETIISELRALQCPTDTWLLAVSSPAVRAIEVLVGVGPNTLQNKIFPHFSGETLPRAIYDLSIELHVVQIAQEDAKLIGDDPSS